MNRSNKSKTYANLALPGMIAVGLIWSLGLLGFGLLRNLQQPESLTDQSQPLPGQQLSKYSLFAQVPEVPLGRFKYSGSPDWSPIRLVVDSAIQAERREYQLSYVQPVDKAVNSTTAIELLLQDKLSFVQSGRPLRPAEIQRAQEKGYNLQQTPVAMDGIAIAVHPSLPIKGLTLSDLAKIYQGQVTNWQQLGGPNLKIQPYSLSVQAEETVDLFLEQVMKGKSYGRSLEFLPTMTESLRQLAASPGGIFFGSAAEIIPQCSIKPLAIAEDDQPWISPYQAPYVSSTNCPNQRNRINAQAFITQQYPLTHQLYVIYKAGETENPGNAYAQLLLSHQGQELLDKAGFVGILKHSRGKLP
ncbi:substrate-binding domain-containing protein [Acaryochloris sp. IP29b_bin.148]|uniref:substrate-binding domain-containing protein n=1 Tax=Acaryochloris sp. IP29b_bin.148 TaxID=2969218 RepID=UPI0026344950|nr:substrate-binding domain-containing protein [Acaryochloris sp. IP29b_bin.148]